MPSAGISGLPKVASSERKQCFKIIPPDASQLLPCLQLPAGLNTASVKHVAYKPLYLPAPANNRKHFLPAPQIDT